jgi:N utilization substance protein B
MQTRRSKAREVALQLLFQNDLNTQPMPRPAHDAFVRDRLLRDRDAISFCESLYEGVQGQREKIDTLLSASAENWKLHRMLPVDRNVLRLATYEMLFAAEPTPATAAINEAIELSRRYGSADSPSFVNGVLDKIAKSKAA